MILRYTILFIANGAMTEFAVALVEKCAFIFRNMIILKPKLGHQHHKEKIGEFNEALVVQILITLNCTCHT